MASTELRIDKQKYVVKSDAEDAHLAEIGALVQARIDSLLRAQPSMAATKVVLLAAVEFASQAIESKRQMEEYRATILAKAGDILERIERELTGPLNPANRGTASTSITGPSS